MAWIESHEGVARHPKTKKLARKLGENVPCAIGRLHLLWWWGIEYAQDGNLSRYEYEDIAEALMWDGDVEVLIDALCESGFIDENPDGALEIHDWEDYAGRLIEKREQNAERMRKARAESKKKRAKNVQRTNRTRVGLPTNRTNQPTNQRSSSNEQDTQGDQSDSTDESETPCEESIQPLPLLDQISLDEYCQAVEFWMIAEGARDGYGAKGDSFKQIQSFHASNVPIDFVKQGISKFAERERSRNKRLTNFAYCAGYIEDLWLVELAKQEPAKTIEFSMTAAATKQTMNGPRSPSGMSEKLLRAMEEDGYDTGGS